MEYLWIIDRARDEGARGLGGLMVFDRVAGTRDQIADPA
jgi:hypothetical protein